MDKEPLKDLETPLLEDGPGSLNKGKNANKVKNPPPAVTENKITESKMDSQMEMFKKIA